MALQEPDNRKIPLAQQDDLLGSTPEEGGTATKDAETKTDTDMGSGNRRHDTSGATTGGSGEGLRDDTENLGGQ